MAENRPNIPLNKENSMAREVKRDEARQAQTGNKVRWVLLISIALAVIVLFGLLGVFG